MAERSTISQVVQIGVETVPGTPVAAARRLQALSIEPSVSADVDVFRPQGQKFAALSSLGKEWVEADLSGRATYDEIVYPLSSVLTAATPVTTGTGQRWTFSPSSTAEDSPRTFTVEHGSAFRADRFAYGLVNEFSMNFSRDSVELGGSMIGRALVDAIVLTAAPTAVPLVPILPTQIDVFMDNTYAGLGTTKLGRLLSAEFSLGSRYGPLWVLDSANPGFVAHVETEPDATLDLVAEADAQAMGLALGAMRDGSTRFIRIRATGPVIGAGPTAYSFSLDVAAKVESPGDFSDEDGVYAIGPSLRIVHDAGWGKALSVEVVNSLATL